MAETPPNKESFALVADSRSRWGWGKAPLLALGLLVMSLLWRT